MSLLLHTGGERVTLAEVMAVEVPEATATYQPVSHIFMLDLVLEGFQQNLPVALRQVDYGLARDGQRLFGVARFDAAEKDSDWGFAVGFRNSYDKSMSAGVSMGASVFVCDNLCFSGSSITVMRKHTANVMPDLNRMVGEAAGRAWAEFAKTDEDLRSYKGIGISEDALWAWLGVMVGRGVLLSGEMLKAARYFTNPPHEEHASQDLYAAYQGVNNALKGAQPTRTMQAHAGLHTYANVLRDVRGNAGDFFDHPTIGGEVAEAK